jgi:hypothetical protein
MRALVMYESEFGATRAVAEAISRGLRASGMPDGLDVEVLDTRGADLPAGWPEEVALVVLGAPTHARSLPSPTSRQAALDWPHKLGSTLRLEPRADAAGMRELLKATDLAGVRVAPFVTRMNMSRLVGGSAAAALSRLVRGAGGVIVAGPQEFLVTKTGDLVEHELDHAYEWGRVLAASIPRAVGARVAR